MDPLPVPIGAAPTAVTRSATGARASGPEVAWTPVRAPGSGRLGHGRKGIVPR